MQGIRIFHIFRPRSLTSIQKRIIIISIIIRLQGLAAPPLHIIAEK